MLLMYLLLGLLELHEMDREIERIRTDRWWER